MATPTPPGANGSQAKPNFDKSKNFGFGATFSPGLNINVNAGNRTNTGSVPAQGGAGRRGGGAHPDAFLPAPEFNSPAQVRHYCNSLRALGTGLSFEVSMAAEIMQATLAQVPDPEGRPWGSRSRARRVSRKLAKSADGMKAAAVNAAAAYAAFAKEFEEEINRVKHRARPRQTGPRINWADQ
jgi:hypothetical protein